MKITKLEIEFTESLEPNLRKEIFNSKNIASQIACLDSTNEREKQKGIGGYDKTYLFVTFENGNKIKFRFDIGCTFGFIETISKGEKQNFTF